MEQVLVVWGRGTARERERDLSYTLSMFKTKVKIGQNQGSLD